MNRRLTYDQRYRMVLRSARGENAHALAREYNVTTNYVHQMARRFGMPARGFQGTHCPHCHSALQPRPTMCYDATGKNLIPNETMERARLRADYMYDLLNGPLPDATTASAPWPVDQCAPPQRPSGIRRSTTKRALIPYAGKD